MSPLLFIIYDEAMVKEATAKKELGVKVGGQDISMIRYANDKAVVASSEKNLQRLMDSISRVTQEYGMKINVKKTKAMCISCLLYTSPSPRDRTRSRMPSSA